MNRPGSTRHLRTVGIDVFERYRRNGARRVVAAFGVVEHFDVIEDIGTATSYTYTITCKLKDPALRRKLIQSIDCFPLSNSGYWSWLI